MVWSSPVLASRAEARYHAGGATLALTFHIADKVKLYQSSIERTTDDSSYIL